MLTRAIAYSPDPSKLSMKMDVVRTTSKHFRNHPSVQICIIFSRVNMQLEQLAACCKVKYFLICNVYCRKCYKKDIYDCQPVNCQKAFDWCAVVVCLQLSVAWNPSIFSPFRRAIFSLKIRRRGLAINIYVVDGVAESTSRSMTRLPIATALLFATTALLIIFHLLLSFGFPELEFLHARYETSFWHQKSRQIPINPLNADPGVWGDGTKYLLGVGKADITGYEFERFGLLYFR